MREHSPDSLLTSAFRTASELKARRGLGSRLLANAVCPRCALASAVFRLCHCITDTMGTKILSVIVRCPKLRGFWYNFGRRGMHNQAVDYNVTAF